MKTPSTNEPSRGEIWLTSLNPTMGHEQAGTRPCLIISVDRLNHGRGGITILIPITSTERGIATHVEVHPPEGALKNRSFIKCEDVRSLSKQRLIKRFGSVSPKTMAEVEDRLRILMGL